MKNIKILLIFLYIVSCEEQEKVYQKLPQDYDANLKCEFPNVDFNKFLNKPIGEVIKAPEFAGYYDILQGHEKPGEINHVRIYFGQSCTVRLYVRDFKYADPHALYDSTLVYKESVSAIRVVYEARELKFFRFDNK